MCRHHFGAIPTTPPIIHQLKHTIMNQITINVYEFNELNAEAKRRAIEDARASWATTGAEDIVGDAFWYTIDKVEEVFGIKVKRGADGMLKWEWKEDSRWEAFIDFNGRLICPEKEPRLLPRYLKVASDRIDTMKTYFLPNEKWVKGRRHINYKRESKVMFKGYHECLTDTYSDLTIDTMMEGRWDYVRNGYTISDFLWDMMLDLKVKWDEELESMTSDESISDLLQGDSIFTENGVVINLPS